MRTDEILNGLPQENLMLQGLKSWYDKRKEDNLGDYIPYREQYDEQRISILIDYLREVHKIAVTNDIKLEDNEVKYIIKVIDLVKKEQLMKLSDNEYVVAMSRTLKVIMNSK